MVTFTRAWTVIFMVLAVHGLAISSGWYEYNKWFDIPMHFAGGFAIGLLALAGLEAWIEKVTFKKSLKPWAQIAVAAVAVMGAAAIVGIVWEWYEFIFDNLAVMYSLEIRPAQMTIGDTLADLAFDLIGALAAFTLFRRR